MVVGFFNHMPIGIRPTNDFAFKKTFGSEGNKSALISLLNAILTLPSPITDVTIKNPFNVQDFLDDKLSILDVKAVGSDGAVYDVEMQLSVFDGLVKRFVYYGCEAYVGQLKAGDDYTQLRPVYVICLIDGMLWRDATKIHHRFRFLDEESGRALHETLEIHTLEFGRYNLKESDLRNASLLDSWVFWFLHAHEYESEDLLRLFPDSSIQLATKTITRISEITEDKAMYDSREKAIRDQQWALSASFREGVTEGLTQGKIELIQTLQQILNDPLGVADELQAMTIEQLDAMIARLRERIINR